MSSIKYPLTLDLRRDLHQVLVMKEGDADSREILITITDNGKIYNLSGYSIDCKWHKPDGTFIFNTCPVSDNTVHILCTEQMLAMEGVSKAEIVLYEDMNTETSEKTVISTMKFHVSINASVVSNKDIESTNEFSALTEIMLKNKEFAESLKNLEETLEENESQRENAEETRKQNETQRILNEDERISAEDERKNTETDRQNNETERIQSEKDREVTENERKEAEQKRQENETARENAEDVREENISTAIDNANTAIDKMESLMEDSNLVHTSDLGVPNGAATLNENGYIHSSQLPSYVDDVKDGHAVGITVDGSTGSKSATGFILDGDTEPCVPETDKIYIDINEGITYRWSGSVFVSIGSPLSLGTTSSMAFPGDRGLSLEKRVNNIEEYHKNIPASDINFDNTALPLLGNNVQEAIEDLSKPATPERDGLLSADDKKRIDNYADIQETKIILYASAWTGNSTPYAQTVTVTGLSVYNNCSIEMSTSATPEQVNAVTNAEISSITYTDSNSLIFTASGTKPSIDVPILLCIGTSMNVVNVPQYLCEMPVTGVKGKNETDYRYGNVELSAENIGAVPLSAIVNNDTTTEDGFVADARIVKTHGDAITSLNNNLTNTNTSISKIQNDLHYLFVGRKVSASQHLIIPANDTGGIGIYPPVIDGYYPIDARLESTGHRLANCIGITSGSDSEGVFFHVALYNMTSEEMQVRPIIGVIYVRNSTVL